jgi:hypothetical protein
MVKMIHAIKCATEFRWCAYKAGKLICKMRCLIDRARGLLRRFVSPIDLFRLTILADSNPKKGLKDDVIEASATSETGGNLDK